MHSNSFPSCVHVCGEYVANVICILNESSITFYRPSPAHSNLISSHSLVLKFATVCLYICVYVL